MKISFPSQRVFNLGFWWEPSDRPLSSVASSLSWRAGDWGTSSGAVFRLNCFYFGKHQSLLLTPSTDCIKSTISWFKCWLPLRKYVLRSACQRSTIWKKMYNSMEYVTMCLRNWISMLPVPHLWPWKGKQDWHFFPHLITVSVLVHAGCCYRMPEAGWFINHVICHSSGG